MHGMYLRQGALGVAFSVFCGAAFAPAAEVRSGDDVVIKAEETIDDDLYVFGRHVTVDGTVNGDVLAFGEQITINGVVNGHIMAAGQTVVILGKAEGARIAGQVLKLGPWAKLDGDILAAGLSLECAKDSDVIGDALFAGYQALFAGKISDDVLGTMSNCRLAGQVGGDVKLAIGSGKDSPPAHTFGPAPPVAMPVVSGGLTVADTAEVEGDLRYGGPQEGKIDEAAKIHGEVEYHPPAPVPVNKGEAPRSSVLAGLLSQVRHVVSVLLVGLTVMLLLPRWTESWVETIRTRPGATIVSGVVGLLAFIALLVVAIIVIILAAILLGAITLGELVPTVVIGGLIGYAAMLVAFWIVYAFLAQALAGLAIGKTAFRHDSLLTRIGALIVGVLLVSLVLAIPYVGSLLGFVVLLFGLGSICLWLVGQRPVQSFVPLPAAKPIPATVLAS